MKYILSLGLAVALIICVYCGFLVGFRLGSLKTSLIWTITDLNMCLNLNATDFRISNEFRNDMFKSVSQKHQYLKIELEKNYIDKLLTLDPQVEFGLSHINILIRKVENNLNVTEKPPEKQ